MQSLYSLEDCIWDWIQFATEKRKPARWIAFNKHHAKRELVAVLEGEFQIMTADDFCAFLVHTAQWHYAMMRI